jgi:putative tricarboxylic transport membrane protein
MKTLRHIGTDAWAGLLLVALGGAGGWMALDMRLGTAISMGPGYFPLMIHAGLMIFGLVIVARGLRSAGLPLAPPLWRPILVISASLLAFWLLIEPAGFIVASVALMLVSILAQRSLGLLKAIALTAGAVAAASLIFVYALKLPFQLLPPFI